MPAEAVVSLLAADGFCARARELGVSVDGLVGNDCVTVDLAAYTATRGGHQLDLSPRQIELLALFLAAPGRVWSREQLEWVCWGEARGSRRVDVQLCRLRARVGLDLFRNVRDRGWALRALG